MRCVNGTLLLSPIAISLGKHYFAFGVWIWKNIFLLTVGWYAYCIRTHEIQLFSFAFFNLTKQISPFFDLLSISFFSATIKHIFSDFVFRFTYTQIHWWRNTRHWTADILSVFAPLCNHLVSKPMPSLLPRANKGHWTAIEPIMSFALWNEQILSPFISFEFCRLR